MANIHNIIDDLEHTAEMLTFISTRQIHYNENALNHSALEVDVDEFVDRINDAVKDLQDTIYKYREHLHTDLEATLND